MGNYLEESLTERAERLSTKYQLRSAGIDCECIYVKGDLANVLSVMLTGLLPEEKFQIDESVSADGKRFIAKVKHSGGQEIEIYAYTDGDFLPEAFCGLLESIPELIGNDKRFYMINPRLLGQYIWYFCGTEAELSAAKSEGLPLIYDGEDFMCLDISEFE